MRNLDEINAVFPLHSRTGCSGTHLINAGFNDHGNLWCPRCQSIWELNLFNQNTALKTQVDQMRESSLVAFGDGFFDGYLHYAKVCGDSDFIEDALRQSELAEADSHHGKQVGSSLRIAEIKTLAGREGYLRCAADFGLVGELVGKFAEEYTNTIRQQEIK